MSLHKAENVTGEKRKGVLLLSKVLSQIIGLPG